MADTKNDSQGTLLLLDGHSMAFRAFYALRAEGFRTPQGQYTNAVHGFLSMLLRLVKQYRPTHVAVAFDLPGGTFRTRMYAEYKGGRKATPEEFKGQIGVIQQMLDVLGIAWLTYEDFEADDIVATLATKAAAAGMRVLVASGDKDTYQLVNDMVTVLYPTPTAMLEMTPELVRQRMGVTPDKYEDLAALVGENADNIPGVPKVGPKTAAKWINEYGSLTELLAHASEISGKVGESLRAHAEQVRLNRQLNEAVRDLPIGADLSVFVPLGVDVPALHELFDVLDFRTLRTRVLAELPHRSESLAPAAGSSAGVAGEMSTEGEIGAESTASAESDAAETAAGSRRLLIVPAGEGGVTLAKFSAAHAGPYALEIAGEKRPGRGSVTAFAVAANDGAAYLAPYELLGDTERQAFQAWLADTAIQKIGHGTKALRHALAGIGAELAGVIGDTELEAYLLRPGQRGYPLAELTEQYVGATELGELNEADAAATGQEELALDLTGAAADASAAYQQETLAQHAVAILNLHEAMMRQLAQQPHFAELLQVELDVAGVLFAMEARGIAVDSNALQELNADFAARVQAAQQNAHAAIGDDSINLSSPKQLQKVLFEQLGLPKTKKTKSGYTTNADALIGLLVKIAHREDAQALAGQQFLTALLEHRDAIKLQQSVAGLGKAIHADDGRIHTTYQQTVAATGRLSSIEPNLQNIPARTEEGLQIRGVFVPGEGFEYLLTADYSQIEMRLMAELSGDEQLIAAFQAGADLHRYVAAQVFGVPEESVTSAQRSRIKAMSYGLVYGLSAFGLSRQLKISGPEAQALMDGYFSRFGKVKHYLDGLVQQARRSGYTETILGRRRYLPELNSTNRQLREAGERMALNAPIQGSAADVIKVAMINVERALAAAKLKSRILLQVHDELVLEVVAAEADRVRKIVEREMGAAGDRWQLSVPLTVSVGMGRSWRAAAH